MMDWGEAGPPSIPIQVAESPAYVVGTIDGTTHVPVMLVKLSPVAI